MRFSVMLDSNTTVHDTPKVPSDHGGTWSKIKLKKFITTTTLRSPLRKSPL